jgi:DNA mismatch repair protein MLH3
VVCTLLVLAPAVKTVKFFTTGKGKYKATQWFDISVIDDIIPCHWHHITSQRFVHIMAAILPLDEEMHKAIRAPAVISSLHNVVEELVMNSLDAGAGMIEIVLDLASFSVEVRDSGIGINMLNEEGMNFGKWNYTSKGAKFGASDSFGFRGEAIAAISSISTFGVTSKKNSACVSSGAAPIYFANGIQGVSGTIVRAGNIFGNMVVRQSAMRAPKELSRIKEFLQKMSLLHHCVSLSLRQVISTRGDMKTVLEQPAQESVSSMFRQMHGSDVVSKMVSVDVDLDGFRVTGLLSPPLPQFCHWTKEYQYSYLGKRWMRGQDIVSTSINTAYTSIFSTVGATKGGGPAAKHANPLGIQTVQFPIFVLQLVCDPHEYDILLEPDKTKVAYRTEEKLRACLKALVLTLLQQYMPDFPAPSSFLATIFDVEAPTEEPPYVSNKKQNSKAGSDNGGDSDTEYFNLSPASSKGSPLSRARDSTQLFPRGDVSPLTYRYKAAFVPTQSPRSPYSGAQNQPSHDQGDEETIQPKKRQRVPSFSSSTSSDDEYNIKNVALRLENHDEDRVTITSTSVKRTEGAVMSSPTNYLFQEYANNDESNGSSVNQEGQQDFLSCNEPSYAAALLQTHRVFPQQTDAPIENLVGRTYSIGGVPTPAGGWGESSSTSTSRGLGRKKFGTGRNFPKSNTLQGAKVTKGQLESASVIGQVDRKYVLMRVPLVEPSSKGQESLLLVADQHAIDERVCLEAMTQAFGLHRDKNLATKDVQIEVNVPSGLIDVLVGSREILASWGFRYSEPVFSTLSKSDSASLTLTSVPIVHDTPLKQTDFIEFLNTLSTQRSLGSLPVALLRPPAINRILASRACRSAIKFGDTLTMPQCEELVQQLGKTDFPFQCAHGRVSVKPVFSTSSLQSHESRGSATKPDYDSLFR